MKLLSKLRKVKMITNNIWEFLVLCFAVLVIGMAILWNKLMGYYYPVRWNLEASSNGLSKYYPTKLFRRYFQLSQEEQARFKQP